MKMTLSDDHNYIAFGIDLLNNEKLIFGIKDIRNNTYFRERIE